MSTKEKITFFAASAFEKNVQQYIPKGLYSNICEFLQLYNRVILNGVLYEKTVGIFSQHFKKYSKFAASKVIKSCLKLEPCLNLESLKG